MLTTSSTERVPIEPFTIGGIMVLSLTRAARSATAAHRSPAQYSGAGCRVRRRARSPCADRPPCGFPARRTVAPPRPRQSGSRGVAPYPPIESETLSPGRAPRRSAATPGTAAAGSIPGCLPLGPSSGCRVYSARGQIRLPVDAGGLTFHPKSVAREVVPCLGKMLAARSSDSGSGAGR